jgi:peptidyl-prolyl cis-trans isomerase D
MVPEFDAAAFAMQPGQTSELVKSQYGFHIIRVTDRKPEVIRPLEEVRAEIQERLTTTKANRLISDQAARLAPSIKSASDLDSGAAEVGAKVTTSEFFANQSSVPGLGPAPQVSDAAFRLKDTEVAGPVDTQRGPAFLALAAKKDPYVPALDEVKERVRDDLIRTRAVEMSRQRAGEIAATLRSARDFSAAAKGLGLEAKDTTLIARGSPLPEVGTSKDVDAVAFSLPVGGVSAPVTTNDATVIVKVTERDDVTPEELKKDRETFRAELLSERRERFFSSYMIKARDRTKVQVHNDAIRRVLAERGL